MTPVIICTEAPGAEPCSRWSACLDDDSSPADMIIGWGHTKDEAIADLLDMLPRVEG